MKLTRLLVLTGVLLRGFGALCLPDAAVAPVTTPTAVVEETRDGTTDYGGRVKTWIWYFRSDLVEETTPVYRDVLDVLPDDVTVQVAVSTIDDESLFREIFVNDSNADRIQFIRTGRWITPWARDRFVIFEYEGRTRMLLPTREDLDADRVGDLAAANMLAEAREDVEVIETELFLEGGDIVMAQDRVFIGWGTVEENVRRGVEASEFRSRLQQLFGRPVVVIGSELAPPPHEHLDMFMASVGHRAMVVGDPMLSIDFFSRRRELGIADPRVRDLGPYRRDDQLALRKRYEAVAAQLKALGYQIHRVPTMHSQDHEVILTWTNAIIENDTSKPRVYLPRYEIPLLDRRAREVWERLGFEVHGVGCDQIIQNGGALRCLTNIWDRERSPLPRPTPAARPTTGRVSVLR